MNCKISVIIPVYNVEKYLAQCLDTIVEQTLREIEIICINDDSKDFSKQILEKYRAFDDRIKIINKENGGYGAACNTGLKLAQGEYISIIEPDDFIDKNMFDDLYNLAKENKADIVKSSFYEYKDSENGAVINKINWESQYKMPDKVFTIEDYSQFIYFHPSIWSCIYKKAFLDKNNIRFVEAKGAGWVDNPFQIQTLCKAKRIFYTDKAYYYYRLTNPTSSSNIVNINNPFDRSDEVHSFLKQYKVTNENFFAFLYKRELAYIDTVLSGLSIELFDFACEKINQMITRMNKDIIYKNTLVNDYERMFYEKCKNRAGISELMYEIKKRNENIEVVNID